MNRVNIVQGEDTLITVRLNESDGDPYDFTGYTELTAVFTKEDGTCLSKTYTLGAIAVVSPDTSGKATITLADTDTELLETGITGFELLIDKGTDRKIVQFKSSLNVLERLCS